MKKLELTTFERVQLLDWLGRQQGTLAEIRRALPVMDALELSDEEKVQVEFVQHANGRVTWKDTDRTFALELEDAQFNVLKPVLQSQWPMARRILAMLEKIEAASSS